MTKTFKLAWADLEIEIRIISDRGIGDGVILTGEIIQFAKRMLERGDPKVTEKGNVKIG